MKKAAIIIIALLSLSGSRFVAAQGFTAAEKTSIDKLRLAGLSVRLALRTHNGNVATKTASDTAALFGEILTGLDEADEKLVDGTFYTLNAAAERDDAQRDILRGLPRTEYMIRAKARFDTALSELAEARGAAVEAQALRTGDTTYQSTLTTTIFYIDQATSRLNLFDRSLTYSTPPQGVCTTPFLNCIQDEAFEFLGQYGYDINDVLTSSWSALPAGVSYTAYTGALSQFWLIQDSGMNVAFQAAGVVTGTVSSAMETLFGGGTSTVNQRFNGLQTNLVALQPTTGTAVDFPRINQKFSDAWRHDDRFGRAFLLAFGGI